ncbi:pyridoxal 5'-phosphate synthase [Xenorhabdus bovienii]|uniref:pyridoxine/pyridoxamine 5'-phosphate oxidase n=1 Tax=Xenorhabdus bovienii TaxID=40576 RepID=UPI0023B24960|nr:pyridoxal 5'-phosphate synthase [Xenorhabdus bovienii]MDE9519319.1 pyridoxal 5'-phosphate synthase [Xenorhabdus bovienii]
MSEEPMAKFHQWWSEYKRDVAPAHPGAVCVSTVSKNGAPSARFVGLKSADDNGFVFCTWFDSPKGQNLASNSHIALTFWWEEKGRQVRVEGTVEHVSEQESKEEWASRSRDAQLATLCFKQSQPLDSENDLHANYSHAQADTAGWPIEKPARWGGYRVIPTSIEFLTFRENRMHLREYFRRNDPLSGWEKTLLQP